MSRKFFFENNVALHLIENQNLKKAFGVVGVTLPNRKELSGDMLDEEYNRVRDAVQEILKDTSMLAVASDGWKKRFAEMGCPLINFILLPSQGGSVFHKVMKASGEVKDAEWVAQKHIELAKQLTEGKPEKLLGFLMDNTSTNRKAMDIMSKEFPMWLLEGCVDHSLSLVVKDLAYCKSNEVKCQWTAQTYKKVRMISNVINDNCCVRDLLHTHQKELYGRVKAVATHCLTRFAMLHITAKDLLDSKEALKLTVIDENWAWASENCKDGKEFCNTVSGSRSNFWTSLEAIVTLVQPLSDALHQLEADKPMLSQVWKVWKSLLKHVEAFESKQPNTKKGAKRIFEQRYEKHCNPSWLAAWLVDPINAVKASCGGGWRLPFRELSPDEANLVRELFQKMCPGEEELVGEEFAALQISILPKEMAATCGFLTKKTKNEDTGRTQIAPVSSRQLFWTELGQRHFPTLSKICHRLLSMHATSCAAERNWSLWGQIYTKARNRLQIQRAEKLIYIRGNSKDVEYEFEADEEVLLNLLG